MRASPRPGATTVRHQSRSERPRTGVRAPADRPFSVSAALPLGLVALLTLASAPGAAADDAVGPASLGDVRVELEIGRAHV